MTMDERIAMGVLVLDKVGIVDEKEHSIPHSFRSQISSFGAAVTMGSLTASVAFFSEQGKSKTNRSLLMEAIYVMLTKKKSDLELMTHKQISEEIEKNSLLKYVIDNHENDYLKQEIVDNAVAIKLAMNAYHLTKEEDGDLV